MGAGSGAALVAHDDASGGVAITFDADMVEVAVRDAAVAVDIAHEAADVLMTFDIGIREDDVLHRAGAADVAEEALAAVGVVHAGRIDADAADGVSVAVIGAVEALAVAADWREVAIETCPVVPRRGFAIGDVGGLAEGHARAAGVVATAVDDARQVFEVALRGYLVGAVVELTEVAEVGLADAEALFFLTEVVARAGNIDVASGAAVGVAQGVVHVLAQRQAIDGDGGHGLVHAVVDVAGLNAADGAEVERRVGGQREDDVAEGRVIGDGDGERMAVLAADRAARDGGTRLRGHGGTSEVVRR